MFGGDDITALYREVLHLFATKTSNCFPYILLQSGEYHPILINPPFKVVTSLT